jgi:hypothetical protein
MAVGPPPVLFKDAAMKLFALAVAALLSLAPTQEKVTLKFNPMKGDKLTKVEKSEMSMKASVSANGQEQALEFAQRESETSLLEILDVSGGAVTKAIYTCKEAVEEKKAPGAPDWDKTEKPLNGRKITASMVEGKLVLEGADGLDEKTRRKLDLVDRSSRLYPRTPIGPGDTWDVQGGDLRAFLQDMDGIQDAKIKMKFVAFKDIDGRRCAILHAQMELIGAGEGQIKITIKIDPEVVVWVERGYALSVKGKGTIFMNADNDQLKMKGEGPMIIDATTKVD